MADYYSIIARAVSRSPGATDEARQTIYEQARTALHERLGDDPRISDAELVNEHYRLEVAIYEVEEDLLLRYAPVCKRRDSSLPSELRLYLRDKGVRTLGTRQGCPAGRVLTWINATICKVLSCEAGRSSSVALNPSTGPLMGM